MNQKQVCSIPLESNHPGSLVKHGMLQSASFFFLIFMTCCYFRTILFFCNKMHLCFEKCLTHFVQAKGALHKIASGQSCCTRFPLCMHAVSAQPKCGDTSFIALLSCMPLPSPGTLLVQLKHRLWGDSVSLLQRRGGR